MNKSVSNSSLSIFDFLEIFFEKTNENNEKQEPNASKRALQLNTSMQNCTMFKHASTYADAR
jgi:hypothetical protein